MDLRQRVVVNREALDDIDLSSIAQTAFDTAEDLVHMVWEEVSSWNVQPFSKLPKWLQDNDFLHDWHRYESCELSLHSDSLTVTH